MCNRCNLGDQIGKFSHPVACSLPLMIYLPEKDSESSDSSAEKDYEGSEYSADEDSEDNEPSTSIKPPKPEVICPPISHSSLFINDNSSWLPKATITFGRHLMN